MSLLRAEALDNFLIDAASALRAATAIGERSCRDGDHLNYGNHDRLIAEAERLRAALAVPTDGAGT